MLRSCAASTASLRPPSLPPSQPCPASASSAPDRGSFKAVERPGSLKMPIPRHVYSDALIVLDEAKRLNNGQPSLWAYYLEPARRASRRPHSSSRLRHRLLHRHPGRAHRPARQESSLSKSTTVSPPEPSMRSPPGRRSPWFTPTARAAPSSLPTSSSSAPAPPTR